MGLKTHASASTAPTRKRRCLGWCAGSLALGATALALGACGGSSGQLPSSQAAGTTPASDPATVATTTTTPAPAPHRAARPHAVKPRRPHRARRHVSPRTTTTPAPATTTTPRTTATTTTAPRTTTTPSGPAPRPIHEVAHVTLVQRVSATHYLQAGPVSGTLTGQMRVDAALVQAGVRVLFTVTVPGGTVNGRALVIPHIGKGKMAPVVGTATITGGTGRYAQIRGSGLKVTGEAALDASTGTVRLDGTVTY